MGVRFYKFGYNLFVTNFYAHTCMYVYIIPRPISEYPLFLLLTCFYLFLQRQSTSFIIPQYPYFLFIPTIYVLPWEGEGLKNGFFFFNVFNFKSFKSSIKMMPYIFLIISMAKKTHKGYNLYKFHLQLRLFNSWGQTKYYSF